MTPPLVFGTGWLGSIIARALSASWTRTDITDAYAVRCLLESMKPSVVVNAAGKTGHPNVDWCKDHPQETFHTNVFGSYNLQRVCESLGIFVIHLGSGCVYRDRGSESIFRKEDDEPNFVGSTYSASMVAKQAVLLPSIRRGTAALLRLRMPIDLEAHPRNLITKLLAYLAYTDTHPEAGVVDAPNSCTFVPDLVRLVRALCESPRAGIVNVVASGGLSPLGIVKALHSGSVRCLQPDELDALCKEPRSHCLLDNTRYHAWCARLGIPEPFSAESVLTEVKERFGEAAKGHA